MPANSQQKRKARNNALARLADGTDYDPADVNDSENIGVAGVEAQPINGVVRLLPNGDQILYFLSIVAPILGALKTLRSLLPSVSPIVSTAVGPSVSYLAGCLFVPTISQLWWACFPMSLIGLGTSRVSIRFPALQFAGCIPYLNWFEARKVVVPLRKVAAAFIFTSLGWWMATKFVARYASPIGARWSTRFISKNLAVPHLSSSQQRQVFVDVPLVSGYIHKNHTHGEAARDRNASGATSAVVCRALGLEPYYVQQSLAEAHKAQAGDRSFHWAKDIAIPPREFWFNPETHAAILVDVDHYVDMVRLLAQHPGTYFVCTFTPTACAKSEGEYSFRFDRSGDVLYRVSGGAEYVHKVWDYSGDTLVVEDCGFVFKRVVVYHIDRKRVDDHHSIVMLTLVGHFTMPAVCPTSFLIQGKQLMRFNPVVGDHVVLDVVKADGLYRSVAIVGDYAAVTLPRSQFDAVHAVALAAKVPITPAMVASNIAPSSPAGLPTERLPPGHAAVIASYTRAGIPEFAPTVYPSGESMLTIMFDRHDYDAPVRLTGFGSPLIGPCYGFASSIASDDVCVSKRIEAFQGGLEQPIPPTLAGFMQEFIVFLVPVAHRGHPVGDDEVRFRQSSPSQRAILERASVTGNRFKRAWSSFQKRETYPKVTDPRNISVAEPATKLAYSRYMYAFTDDIMSEQDWYAFNKTPYETALRVCEVLLRSHWSICADGSRFDGHVCRRARILERMVMLRYFAPEHHSGLNEAMNDQISLPGTTEFGRRYNSGFSRGSGSLETANFNSILTAFIGYCAHRNTCVNGARKSPEQAWASLGIYGGDDSLEGDVDADALQKSSELMGQKYEIEVIPRGSRGVEFLNRQFSEYVWEGDPNSMANPARLLAKLFVGPTNLVDVLTRLAERLSGYRRMDGNSPVIGLITEVAEELLGDHIEGELMPYWGDCPADTNWPNEDSGWMRDLFDEFIPDFDYGRFNNWIDRLWETRDPQLLLQAPLCTSAGVTESPVVKQTCIVGDALVDPPVAMSDNQKGKLEVAEASASAKTAQHEVIAEVCRDALHDLFVEADKQVKLPPFEDQAPPENLCSGPGIPGSMRNTAQGQSSTSTGVLRQATDHARNRSPRGTSSRVVNKSKKSMKGQHPDHWNRPRRYADETDGVFQARLKDFEAAKQRWFQRQAGKK